MPDLSDNGSYLILGYLAFWLPVLGYGWYLRSRAATVAAEEALLREELAQR
jgi:hypothetical protein